MDKIRYIRNNIGKKKKIEKKDISEIPFHKLQKRKWLSLSDDVKNDKKQNLRIMTYNILANSNIFHFLYKNHNENDLNNEIRMKNILKLFKKRNK